MSNAYSADELGNFMEWAISKGLMKQETARSRKIAAQKVLGALDASEREDVRTVDRDVAFDRFVNKNGRDFTPQSLSTYRSRFNSALDDFLRYKENPTSFRFDTAQRKSRSVNSGEKPEVPARTQKTKSVERTVHDQLPSPAGVSEIVFPIPIRPGLVVRVHNLPNNLTKAEAQRIAAVIMALAVSDAT